MFLVNSRPRRFSAAPRCSSSSYLHTQKHPFSRSYGAILPSSLAGVLSSALGCSPRPPVSVCGTVSKGVSLRGFSRQLGLTHFNVLKTRHHLSALSGRRICLSPPPTGLHRDIQHPAGLPFCVTPSLKRLPRRRRNINLLPIGYASRPRLRGRLTQGRLTLPWKPWAYGEEVSHPLYRYSCQHLHFPNVHHSSRMWLLPLGNAPLPRAPST